MQPDYYIDENSREIKLILDYGKRVSTEEGTIWEKISRLHTFVNEQLRKKEYDAPEYVATAKRYRETGGNVPLSEYLVCGACVCREHALITHLLLKAAGIQNFYVYAQIRRSSRYDNFDITEDHAFTVIKVAGRYWVVDFYYWGFHGFQLEDLMSERGITESSESSPVARPGPGFRRIIKINRFPRIWIKQEDAEGLANVEITLPNGCELMSFQLRNSP